MRYSFSLMILFFFLASLTLQAKQCEVKGTAEDYAGQHVPVYIIDNPFIKTRQTFDTIHFDSEGRFNARLNFPEEEVIYFDLGKFIGYLYITDGYEYELLLPPFIKKTHKDRINPFYQQVEVHLKVSSCRSFSTVESIENELEINNLIVQFDTLFSKLNQEILINRQNRIPVNADSMINRLEKQFSQYKSPLLNEYRVLRYGILKVNEGKTRLGEISNGYLQDKIPRIHDPAYQDLFNALFDDFLVYFSQTPEGANVSSAINRRQSLTELRNEMRRHPAVFSDTLADLLIIKEISQQYYENFFIKDALLIILDSLSSEAVMEEYRRFATDLHRGFVKLTIGNQPPDFRLRDQSGIFRTMKDFNGKYVYIFFCTPDNYSCMTEYPYLNSFYQKHRDYLDIVTVMVSEKFQDMVSFMEKNNYGWTALYYDDQVDILQEFNVRYFPSAYLIGPDGTLVQSPATLPSEGFQMQLFRIMRSRGEI